MTAWPLQGCFARSRQTTKPTLRSGLPLPARAGSGSDDVCKVKPGTALRVPTRHPVSDEPIAVIDGTVCMS
ncbi:MULTISPECIES: hypothetical protein [unclassified Streptomyces]|uniref:hypothetical protein n=1 Tax=unclassified Streptomyces TaxID=2593676 RepID=UPI002366E177|nr:MULTISPECIES: hypothetical protein [unclassified Streptomyces]MDF3145428.1 hypothetical protein [Streptomyces sp. T21Q-yed]WDF41270.1 hypothetical protein PBV52_33020 [Streptomyces sp. T12]